MKKTILLIGFIFVLFSTVFAHPIHVSVSNLEFTGEEPLIAIKLFKDDLQLAIYHNYAIEIPFEKMDNNMYRDIMMKYLSERFIIKLNKNENLKLEYENIETNDEAIWFYFQTKELPPVKKITVLNKIFLDIYQDQTNLLIINYKGKQRGYRFDFRTTEMEVELK